MLFCVRRIKRSAASRMTIAMALAVMLMAGQVMVIDDPSCSHTVARISEEHINSLVVDPLIKTIN
jgi:hypothetical protein